MAAVARLVGMELRSYEKDGKKKTFCTLHLCHVDGSVKNIMGCKCENLPCPRDVDPDSLTVGSLYELDHEIYDFKGETRARLQDLFFVEEPVMAANN